MTTTAAPTDGEVSEPTWAALHDIGLGAGLSAVGLTTAEVLEPARTALGIRKSAGLAGTMQFTYRNPERSTDPGRVVPGARTLIVGLRAHGVTEPAARRGAAGRIARYARGDHYGALRQGLDAIADALRTAGRAAVVVADSNHLVDRNAAWRAGLAAYGKNANLLAPGIGSWFVVGAVITDAEFGPVGTPTADVCGPCTACIDGCPTGAIVAPGVVDARRCIAWLVQAAEPIAPEFRVAVGDRIYGCDLCQEVCPPNRSVPPIAVEPGSPSEDAWVDLVWALSVDDDTLLAAYGRWYIADRDPDVIRRTALVVLGNVADPGPAVDSPVAAVVARYLAHPSPLLRAHAVWAARRLGLDALAAATRTDADEVVRGEWDEPVAAR